MVCSLPGVAAIVIDPDGIGATNVTPTYNGSDDPWVLDDGLVFYVGDLTSVGVLGSGELRVDGGSRLVGDGVINDVSGGTSRVTVSGAGSVWESERLTVASEGRGELNIEAGGAVETGKVYTGTSPWATSAINVSDVGSSLVTGHLYVGWNGESTLMIQNGATVISGGGSIGESSHMAEATVTGVGSSWAIGSGLFTLGYYGRGNLNILDGGTVSSDGVAFIGYFREPGTESGGEGTALISGSGSSFETTDLWVGFYGAGVMRVEDGGFVSSSAGSMGGAPTASGHAVIDGVDSRWDIQNILTMGFYQGSDSRLDIINGGQVSQSSVYIGRVADTTAAATVNGPGSLWSSDAWTFVGYDGEGELTIENGGVLTGTTGIVASEIGSTGAATVTGDGSAWHSSATLTVGRLGNGTLDILDGASADSFNGVVGMGQDVTGAVSVSGAGSHWEVSNQLMVGGMAGRVGTNGQGTLLVSDGGSVSNVDATLGLSAASSGIATVRGLGSEWINSGSVDVGQLGSGTLNVEDGGVVRNTIGFIGLNAGSTGAVTVSGVGSTWTNSAALYVGGSDSGAGGTGILNVREAGAVTADTLEIYSTATLNLSVASLTDALIDVAGDATLAGTLNVDLDSAFTLTAGDAFTLIDIGGMQSGVFSNYAEDDLLGNFNGVDMFLSYTGGDGNDVVAYATATAILSGDYNGNGAVDAADYTVWQDNFGSTLNLAADGNGNGVVDAADYTVWQDQFGQGVSTQRMASIPEPGSLGLLLLAAALNVCGRRGRSRA